MYERYKREHEKLKVHTVPNIKSKDKSDSTKKPLSQASVDSQSKAEQKQDASTSATNFVNDKNLLKDPNKRKSDMTRRKSQSLRNKSKKRRKRKLWICFKFCKKNKVKAKETTDKKSDEKGKIEANSSSKSDHSIPRFASKSEFFKRIRSSDKVQIIDGKSDTKSASSKLYNDKSSAIEPSRNSNLKEEKPIITVSTELHGLNKVKKGNKSNESFTKKPDNLKTAEHKEDLKLKSSVKLQETSDFKDKKEVQKKDIESSSERSLNNGIEEKSAKTVIFKGNSYRDSFEEKKLSGFSTIFGKIAKEDAPTASNVSPNSYSAMSCPFCLQNANTVASIYARGIDKESGSLHVSINNYYSDKWQKQLRKIKRPQVRTVQTSVRPRSKDASTMTDPKLCYGDNSRCAACARGSSDEKITICRMKR